MKAIPIMVLLLLLNISLTSPTTPIIYIPISSTERVNSNIYKYPKAMKRNNPFNIRTNAANNWVGKVPNNKQPFEVFTELDYGIRAGFKLLQNYNKKYGINTIESIVHRFAPPIENDTNNYIKVVCIMTGFKPNQELNLFDKDTLLKLTAAMIYVEQGIYISPLDRTYHRFFS